jgi:hypothetical protein
MKTGLEHTNIVEALKEAFTIEQLETMLSEKRQKAGIEEISAIPDPMTEEELTKEEMRKWLLGTGILYPPR